MGAGSHLSRDKSWRSLPRSAAGIRLPGRRSVQHRPPGSASERSAHWEAPASIPQPCGPTTLLQCFLGRAGPGRFRLDVVAPEPNLAGAHYRLGPVGDLQLGEDIRDVVAHRLGAHVKLPGYLGIGATPGYEV